MPFFSNLKSKLTANHNPLSGLSKEEWDQWEVNTKKEHPIWYFFHVNIGDWFANYKNPLKKLYDFFRYEFPRGISNIIRWSPIIWKDRDWDWSYLACVMEYKFNRMADYDEKYGHHVCSLRNAKEERICATLLRRLMDDNYDEQAGLISSWSHKSTQSHLQRKLIYDKADKMRKYDQEYLGRLIGKKLINWGD